jgi:hypothetical protein
MAKANKFSLPWQIVRVQVRSIKNVPQKISRVVAFLKDNPNAHNYERVMNWLKMTQVAYKGDDRLLFDPAIHELTTHKSRYDSQADTPVDLSKFSTADIQMVLKDLSKRKYGFQFATTPKDHIAFVEALHTELASRDKHGK